MSDAGLVPDAGSPVSCDETSGCRITLAISSSKPGAVAYIATLENTRTLAGASVPQAADVLASALDPRALFRDSVGNGVLILESANLPYYAHLSSLLPDRTYTIWIAGQDSWGILNTKVSDIRFTTRIST
eukprot:gene2377-8684_t